MFTENTRACAGSVEEEKKFQEATFGNSKNTKEAS